MKKKLQQQAVRLHTHTVVFQDPDDIECACRALMGQSTLAISKATGLSESQVQYRITKAGINRWDFRHGKTELAKRMIDLGREHANNIVEEDIAPQFEKLAPRYPDKK